MSKTETNKAKCKCVVVDVGRKFSAIIVQRKLTLIGGTMDEDKRKVCIENVTTLGKTFVQMYFLYTFEDNLNFNSY